MARDFTSVELHPYPDTSSLYLQAPSLNVPTRPLSPIRITREHYLDDGTSTALSSPALPPEPCRSPSPLLERMEEPATSVPAEPPPSFNPPSYRAVVSLPSYSAWTDKYTRIPNDAESLRTYPKGFGLRYYGWRIWSVVVAIIVVTVVSIVVALTQHQSGSAN
jgi:hypothetical protein